MIFMRWGFSLVFSFSCDGDVKYALPNSSTLEKILDEQNLPVMPTRTAPAVPDFHIHASYDPGWPSSQNWQAGTPPASPVRERFLAASSSIDCAVQINKTQQRKYIYIPIDCAVQINSTFFTLRTGCRTHAAQ